MNTSNRAVSLAAISPSLWRGTEESAGWVKPLPRLPVVEDRQAFLSALCRGKSVIHVGFGDAGAREATESEGRWVHDAIARNASRVIGLDVDSDSVEMARAQGWEAYQADCTDPEAIRLLGLPEADLIILGEVIEHVGNPGGLLSAMRVSAGPATQLVVTTPNALRIATVVNVAARQETSHPDHVAIWTMPLLAQLVARNGWRPTHAAMYQVPSIRDESTRRSKGARGLAGRIVRKSADRLVRSATPYWADGLILVAATLPMPSLDTTVQEPVQSAR